MVADHQRSPGFCACCCWWPSDAPPARPVGDAGPVRRARTPRCGVDVVARPPSCWAERQPPVLLRLALVLSVAGDAPPALLVGDAGSCAPAGRPCCGVDVVGSTRRAGH